MSIHKEFTCKQCNTFFNNNETVNGVCPDCGGDEDVFANELSIDLSDDDDESEYEHENERINQGDGFVYVTCEDCGEDL